MDKNQQISRLGAKSFLFIHNITKVAPLPKIVTSLSVDL